MAKTVVRDSMLQTPPGGVADIYTFATVAEAAAASPGNNVFEFQTLSRSTPGDGGGARWRYNPLATAPLITCANGRKYELAVDVVNVKIFGALGNNTGNDAPAISSAIAYAKAKNLAVYLPSGYFRITSAITIDWAVSFFGLSYASVLRPFDMTTEVFRVDLGAAAGNQINYASIGNFCIQAEFSSGGVADSLSAFRVVGPTNSYFQWALIKNILCRGCYAFWSSDAGHHVTSFGNEGPCSWNKFENISFQSFTRQQKFGFIFNTGSGTGNKFRGIHGFIDNWVWLYQGQGGNPYVVGDIDIEFDQFGSYNTTTSAVFVVGSNMQYRSRINIKGGQADAGMASILQLSNVGNPTFDNVTVNVKRGGNCIMGHYPQLVNSNLGPALSTIPAA